MNKSTIRIKNKKDFKQELSIIHKLNSLEQYRVKIIEDDLIKATLSKGRNNFKLELNSMFEEIDEDSINLSFFIDNISYQTQKIGSVSNSTKLRIGEEAGFQTKYELKEFHSKNFSEKSTYKAFFEVDLKEINTFHWEFETVTYQRDEIKYPYDCLRIKLKNKEYDVTQLKQKGKGFYIFECLQEQSYDEFSKVCYSIQQALGFINKFMVGDEKFVFDSIMEMHYSSYIRPSLKGMYNPIVTNPYKYLDVPKSISEEYLEKLTRLSLKNLSDLVNKIHDEPEFSIAILVIMEVTTLKSLLLIPSSFSVIIEQLSKHFAEEEIGLEKPIEDKNIEVKILKELHKVIDSNSGFLTDNSILKIKRRLNEFNKPINKKRLTNNEKLTRPFEQLGINLTLHDINIIEHRNDLLHGNILLKTDVNKSEENINSYMAYVSAKLFTLISKLLLKSIGYKGYIYNQSKYLEKHIGIETEEKYFEKI